MATTTKFVAFATFLLLAASFSSRVSAHSPPKTPATAASPGPAATDCFSALIGLSDCLTYVQEGSNLAKPEKACCTELSKLVDTKPICLCQLLVNPNATGVNIDTSRAIKLPSVCKVKTPPISTCSAVGVPVSLPSTSLVPSGGPAASPSSGASSPPSPNAAISIQVSVLPFTLGLVTAFVSIFF